MSCKKALNLGALGYVVKARAGTDLLAAVEAVLQGRRFVSTDLLGQNFVHPTDAQVPNHLHHEGGTPISIASHTLASASDHFHSGRRRVVLSGLCNYQQRSVIRQIAAHDADLSAAITQLHSQLQDVTTKINDIAAVQATPGHCGGHRLLSPTCAPPLRRECNSPACGSYNRLSAISR